MPKDRKYTRKGESDGKKLTPGERAINWCKAFAIIVPLVGVGAVGNSQTVKTWIHGEPLAQVDDTTELLDVGIHPEVRQAISELVEKNKALVDRNKKRDVEIATLRGKDATNYQQLEVRIKHLEGLVQ